MVLKVLSSDASLLLSPQEEFFFGNPNHIARLKILICRAMRPLQRNIRFQSQSLVPLVCLVYYSFWTLKSLGDRKFLPICEYQRFTSSGLNRQHSPSGPENQTHRKQRKRSRGLVAGTCCCCLRKSFHIFSVSPSEAFQEVDETPARSVHSAQKDESNTSTWLHPVPAITRFDRCNVRCSVSLDSLSKDEKQCTCTSQAPKGSSPRRLAISSIRMEEITRLPQNMT